MKSTPVLVTALCLLTGCSADTHRTAAAAKNPGGSDEISTFRRDATTQSELGELYILLSARIGRYNGETPIDGWRMNSEHLFIEDESLLKDVVDFSRRPRAIDFLFRRILNKSISDDELLKIGEIMVYFVDLQLDGDQSINSELSTEVREAVQSGRFQAAEARLRKAPVSRYILLGAQKAFPVNANVFQNKNGTRPPP